MDNLSADKATIDAMFMTMKTIVYATANQLTPQQRRKFSEDIAWMASTTTARGGPLELAMLNELLEAVQAAE